MFLDGNQITWKKDDKLLVVDEEVFEDNIDAEKKNDGSIITIKKAKEEDGGEYVCHVLAEKLTHKIDIIGKERVIKRSQDASLDKVVSFSKIIRNVTAKFVVTF